MPPALTGWPPYTLTPRLCPLESLPFLVLPPPFLCAASMVRGALAGHTQGAGACILTPKKPVWRCAASMLGRAGGCKLHCLQLFVVSVLRALLGRRDAGQSDLGERL